MPGPPRRHHYVTKAYLNGFLEPTDSLLFCYGRKRSKPFRAAPENLAHIRDYHCFLNGDGTLDYSLEKEIGQKIESPGLPVIRSLASGETGLNRAQKLSLARLIGLQNVRIPYEREFMDHQHKIALEGYIADMDEESRRIGRPVNTLEVAVNVTGQKPKPNEWFRVTRETVNAELRAIEADPGGFSRGTFFELAENIAKTLLEMQWNVFYAAGKARFITSDRPVITRDKTGGRVFPGLKDPNTEVLFPLSKDAILKIEHNNFFKLLPRKRQLRRQPRVLRRIELVVGKFQAGAELVQSFNSAIATHSYLWAFSGVGQAWLLQEMQVSSPIPKLTRANIVASEMGLNNYGQTVRTKKEFVVMTHE